MQTILFYGRDGAKAKERAKELRKASKGRVLICDVTVWEGTKDGDRAEIMDCVSYFDRQRIEHVFGASEEASIIRVDKVNIVSGEDVGHGIDGPLTEFKSVEEEPAPKKRGRPRKNAEAV